jgi:fatty acid desaturase
MPKKIKATKKQGVNWAIHLIIFILVNAVLWYICYAGKEGWQYPWPLWITSAWGLLVIGHACMIWSNYEDKGMDEWIRQVNNG